MRKLLIYMLLCVVIYSCSDGLMVADFKAIEGGNWNKEAVVEFSFSEIDSLDHYNMYLNIRNDETYPYSNLFLITELSFPNGETVRDTLEYEMAAADGTWLGKGFGSIKENKLWYKENIVFPVNGVYTLQISHAMRKNGKVNGIEQLEGITDVGFEIEKSK